MRICLLVALALLLAAPAAGQERRRDVASSEILDESARSYRAGTRVVHLWWLPAEYWVAAATELKKSPDEIDEVRRIFRSYTLIGVIDVDMRPDGSMDALSTAEIVRRMRVAVNGRETGVLRQVDPRLQELAPDIAYVFISSLVHLGGALRLIAVSNITEEGETVLRADKQSQLRIDYRAVAAGDPLEFWWHAPLTAVAGPRRCETGELAEASWRYCPWDGTKLP